MGSITVLAPDYEAARPTEEMVAAPRQVPQHGMTVTIIENGKPNARVLLRHVADELAGRLPEATVDVHSKPSAGKAIDADEADMLAARSHLVLSGIGD